MKFYGSCFGNSFQEQICEQILNNNSNTFQRTCLVVRHKKRPLVLWNTDNCSVIILSFNVLIHFFYLHLLPFSLLAPASPGHPSGTLSICPARLPLLWASSAGPAALPPAVGHKHKQWDETRQRDTKGDMFSFLSKRVILIFLQKHNKLIIIESDRVGGLFII